VLRDDGKLTATTRFDSPTAIPAQEDAAERSKNYVRRHWRYHEPAPDSKEILERAQSHTLCISGMAFQDAWNIDLQRLKRCCIHVVSPRQKVIPFCSYYITDSSGKRLAF
jgi:7,8-dihydro-6-hydroxymethylpterin dimethyltransferase